MIFTDDLNVFRKKNFLGHFDHFGELRTKNFKIINNIRPN